MPAQEEELQGEALTVASRIMHMNPKWLVPMLLSMRGLSVQEVTKESNKIFSEEVTHQCTSWRIQRAKIHLQM